MDVVAFLLAPLVLTKATVWSAVVAKFSHKDDEGTPVSLGMTLEEIEAANAMKELEKKVTSSATNVS